MSLLMEHITAMVCPECGCTDIREFEKSNKHSNGQWNERLEFVCGLKLHYSPNFKRVEQEEDCAQSDRAVGWKSQRKSIAKAMIQAAKVEAGKLGADLGSLETRLRIDLSNYRDELEQVTRSIRLTPEEGQRVKEVWSASLEAIECTNPQWQDPLLPVLLKILAARGIKNPRLPLMTVINDDGYTVTEAEYGVTP